MKVEEEMRNSLDCHSNQCFVIMIFTLETHFIPKLSQCQEVLIYLLHIIIISLRRKMSEENDKMLAPASSLELINLMDFTSKPERSSQSSIDEDIITLE